MILDDIVDRKTKRVYDRKLIIPLQDIYEKAFDLLQKNNLKGNKFKSNLKKEGLSVIGEFKKASPSKGIILHDFNISCIGDYYNKLGIDVASVLTEEDFFLGKDEYIKEVKSKVDCPVLRKDFIIDFYQIYESKVLGADGILLIVSILKDKLYDFYNEAKKFNLEPLVEVHNKEELDIALDCGCEIIGINNRNLKTFQTSTDISKDLIKYIPSDKVIISESGIKCIDDLKMIKEIGADGILVGEMFMRNINNETFINAYMEFRNGKN
ncbi:indole-3-glycerol phosphate synthase TrpC [Clostridium uliginosum]|uniref:Indole-3-glycerol phosphate synthase n=1 Tax=Clostridium uliginosum TaxID=119641 RepID=A0A1I1H5Y0_9CLOT|nr:indole-3-glycerol phosphate synthase TrpC [Clostridium uliginosum]SFC18982.1 indole-3-glycerol phosphate synthase [Clostridium uliginosum]